MGNSYKPTDKTPVEYSFNSITSVIKAARFWYNSADDLSMHKAEMRLMRGEKPE